MIRRADMTTMVPAELAIKAAIQHVEAMSADERLTEAVILLSRAFDQVADYVDSKVVVKKNGTSPLSPKKTMTPDDYKA